jgi:hypothetical protein
LVVRARALREGASEHRGDGREDCDSRARHERTG